jgi:hypothetical protein
MADRTDICGVDDDAWEQAVARDVVVRPLASKANPDRAEFLSACRKLGIKRSRLYELIGVYKARPVTSSLLTAPAGSPAGSRRLPEEIEGVISEAIEGFFKSRQKPSVHALQKEVHTRAAPVPAGLVACADAGCAAGPVRGGTCFRWRDAGDGVQVVQARRTNAISEPGAGVRHQQRHAPC